MKRQYFSYDKDGFYGAYYENPKGSSAAIISMAGDNADDILAKAAVKWLHDKGVNVMAMSPAKNCYDHLNYELERFERAIKWLKANGNQRIGIMGASTTGMSALTAASYFDDITLTVAMTASDFIMEGFYTKDGLERPGDNGESSLSINGEPLKYLPFAYRHPEYAQALKDEAKAKGNMVASREMFDKSEELHPVTEDEKIKIENIKGRVIVIGAEDDCLWDTCRYMRRMQKRLDEKPHDAYWDFMFFEHGTHFVFPEGMMKKILPVGSSIVTSVAFKEGRLHKKECKQARIDIDNELTGAIVAWG